MKEITREIMTLQLQKKDPSGLLKKLSGHSLFFISCTKDRDAAGSTTPTACLKNRGEPLCFLSAEGAELFLSCAEIDRSLAPKVQPITKEACRALFFPTTPESFSVCSDPPITLSLSKDVFFRTFFPFLLQKEEESDLLLGPLPSGGLFPGGSASSNPDLNRARLFSFLPDLLEARMRQEGLSASTLDQTLKLPSGTTRRLLNRTLTRLTLSELQGYLACFDLEPFLYLFSSYSPALKDFLFHERPYDLYSYQQIKVRPEKMPPDTMQLLSIEEEQDEKGYFCYLYRFQNLAGTELQIVPVSYPFGLKINAWYRLDPL